jgi:hypothetical protein
VRSRGNERCEVLCGADDLDFVLMRVLLLGHGFEVLDPPELAGRCHALAERLPSAGTAESVVAPGTEEP